MSDREFYVGYLPLPAGHRRLLRVALPLLLWGMALVAAGFLMSFRPAGDGVWDTQQEGSWTGRLVFGPYPMLLVTNDEGVTEEWWLVEMGKRAADERAEALDTRDGMVTVRGYRLEREGRRMIELAPDADALVASDAGELPALPSAERRGPVTLRGEILDSKCYLGAMRPGDGWTHQACARLCIDGGIPPMLFVTDRDGRARSFLLTLPDGGRANEAVRASIGMPIEVRGEWLERGGSTLLALDPASLRRL